MIFRVAAVALLLGLPIPAWAQTASAVSSVDPGLIDDLVAPNRILAYEKVLDGYGHVSVRDPRDPDHYHVSR
jgi:hypothetical protein